MEVLKLLLVLHSDLDFENRKKCVINFELFSCSARRSSCYGEQMIRFFPALEANINHEKL